MTSRASAPMTLPDKIWKRHLVRTGGGEPDLLYIDLHLVHEVSSPQAFEGLRVAGRTVRRPDLTVATEDHNVPTEHIDQPIADLVSARQVEVLRENTAEFGITLFPMGDPNQGIVHVIGPEQGRMLPGTTIVCGDSHTSTHGAFGALAFGIGTSEVEHVLATQTLPQTRPKWMSVTVDGELPDGITAKDVILAIIGQIGTGGGIGHVIEYRGSAITSLSMEGRMTVCNMSIEAGARAGVVAPDETTFDYLRGRAHAPTGDALDGCRRQLADATDRSGRGLGQGGGDRRVDADAAGHVGDQPGSGGRDRRRHPDPESYDDPSARESDPCPRVHGAHQRDEDARHHGRHGVHRQLHEQPDRGPARRSRRAQGPAHRGVADARGAGQPCGQETGRGRGPARGVSRGGAEWREPGCSMCLGMNPDKLTAGERSASTSNRNFEGRQGRGARTHLVSPTVAAATAVAGHFALPTDLA